MSYLSEAFNSIAHLDLVILLWVMIQHFEEGKAKKKRDRQSDQQRGYRIKAQKEASARYNIQVTIKTMKP